MKKKKSLEQKIYEKLGVRSFKKLVIGAVSLPIKIYSKIYRRDYNEIDKTDGSNYFLNTKQYGKDAPKEFVKMLWYNTMIHLWLIFMSIPEIIKTPNLRTIMLHLPHIILLSYCIMLQRYNGIRISQLTKRREELERKRAEKEKSNIVEKSYPLAKELDTPDVKSLEEYIKELENLRDAALSLDSDNNEKSNEDKGYTKRLTQY